MTEDRRAQPSGKLLRLLIAAVAFAFITLVAIIGSVLLFGPVNLSLPWFDPRGGPDGGGSEILAVPTATATAAAPATPSAAAPATPTDTPSPTGTPTPVQPEAQVTEGPLNLREGPGTNYGWVGQVEVGQRLRITGRNRAGDWLQICCPAGASRESWISAAYVGVNVPISTLPEFPDPPTPTPTATIPAAELTEVDLSLPAPGGYPASGGVNPLTGQRLAAGRENLRPVIVCINNDIQARPQYGITQADLIYEYLMEGFSLTRFSAIFYGSDAREIGPIRSARFINYFLGAIYDAGLFCSGASDDIRYLLKNQNSLFPYLDIDIDDTESIRYSRSVGNDYRTRLRTSSEMLRRWLSEWFVERAPSIQGFTFGHQPAGGIPATSVQIPYPSVTASQVAYRYDVASGRYLRYMGGVAHLDKNNNQQAAVENVIIQYVPHDPVRIQEDAYGNLSLHIRPFGAGRAIVFRDGLAFEGTWRNNRSGELPRFFLADGREIPLKPGRSWISIAPLTYEIAYQ